MAAKNNVWSTLYLMPLNKPIPDSVINYWKNVFSDFLSKFSDPKKAN